MQRGTRDIDKTCANLSASVSVFQRMSADLQQIKIYPFSGLGVLGVLFGKAGGRIYSAGKSPVRDFSQLTIDLICPSVKVFPS